MIKYAYQTVRFILYPIIFLADFMQNNFTNFFTPMNIGPVSENSYGIFLKNNIKKNDFVLDFGSGAGFFSTLFDKKKYLGVEINKNFVLASKKKYKNYNFRLLNKYCLDGYKNKINIILINNVMHHLSDAQIEQAFFFFKRKLRPKTKVFIVEPLFPKTFLSWEFFFKALDVGHNIKNQKNYLKIFRKCFFVNSCTVKEIKISHVLILKGFLKKSII
jgi:SAM-dependent methyltransferase